MATKQVSLNNQITPEQQLINDQRARSQIGVGARRRPVGVAPLSGSDDVVISNSAARDRARPISGSQLELPSQQAFVSDRGPLQLVPQIEKGPFVTEEPQSNAEYQRQTRQSMNRTPKQIDKFVNEGGFKNYGNDQQFYGGVDEEGNVINNEVNKSDFDAASERYNLVEAPLDADGNVDINLLATNPVYRETYAVLTGDDNIDTADRHMADMEVHFDNLLYQENVDAEGNVTGVNENYDQDVSIAYNKLLDNNVKMNQRSFSHIQTLSLAAAMRNQDAYTTGKITGANSMSEADRKQFGIDDIQGVQEPNQIGLPGTGLISNIVNRTKQLFNIAGIDYKTWSEIDFQSTAKSTLQQALDSTNIVRQVVDKQATYIPVGAHVGTVLGLQSDTLVGVGTEIEVSSIPPLNGRVVTQFGALPGQEGRKSPSKNPPVQITIDQAKDIMSHMAYGMDADVVMAVYAQISDVMMNMVIPNADAMNQSSIPLMYSTSEFAPMFKLDYDTAEASYKHKLYARGASENRQEQTRLQQDTNKITNQRVDEIITNLNKQLSLIKNGDYAAANKAFYYTFGNGDINGRIYNTTHNGNYTLDKVVARNTQRAKINPRVQVNFSDFGNRNIRINKGAKSLFNAEGNPKEFNKIINAMPKDIEAEISFRLALMHTILKDAKTARKKIGKNESTPEGMRAIEMAEASGLGPLRNVSNAAAFAAYNRINANDPMKIIRYFGAQGAEIREALDNTSKKLFELEVIEFDPLGNAADRKQQALESWGDITTNNIKPLAKYANHRGEVRQQMSIRDNALKYMLAYDKSKTDGSGVTFEMDFEIEMDATQSGPFLQNLIAPSSGSRETLGVLGYYNNTTKGDLRDAGKKLLMNGTVVNALGLPSDVAEAWGDILNKSLSGQKANIGRELLLKQTIMQYYYGKPASMFGDIAEEWLGYFDEEITQNGVLKGLSTDDRINSVKAIIGEMLSNKQFDVTYINTMKRLGMTLALTGSDLKIDGPMGPINLTMESLVQAFEEQEGMSNSLTPESMKLALLELFDPGLDSSGNVKGKFTIPVTQKRTDTFAVKPTRFDQSKRSSGANYPSRPGKRLADSLGVLIIHQLDNAIMNQAVNSVQANNFAKGKNRGRNSPLPAKIIYDAIITNAAGFLRYQHAYNNEAIPMLAKWDLGAALKKLESKAASEFKKENKGKESFNISVIQGEDGNLHGVERYSVLTTFLDDYWMNMPRREQYADNQVGAFNAAVAEYTGRGMKNIALEAKQAGYKAPIINEIWYETGVLERGEPLILNAAERANMILDKQGFDELVDSFLQRNLKGLNTFIDNINREKKKADDRPKTNNGHLRVG